MGYMCLFKFRFPQGICLGVGLLGHMVVLFLVFNKFPYRLPVLVSIYIPINSARMYPFSPHSPSFIVCRLFNDGHSDWCKLMSHCSFDLSFSNNEQCRASFHVFVSHLYVFFEEMSVQAFFSLFDWVVCFSGIELHEQSSRYYGTMEQDRKPRNKPTHLQVPYF